MKGIVWGLAGLSLLAGCASVSQKGASDEGRIAIAVTEKGFEPASVTVPELTMLRVVSSQAPTATEP